MESLNIGLFGNDVDLLKDVAKAFGKKGTESDITLYNHKSGELVVTTILPHSYPDKIQSLFYTINLCDLPVIVIGALNQTLGELLLILDKVGFEKGLIFLKEEYMKDQIQNLISKTTMKDFEIMVYTDETAINELRIKTLDMKINNEDNNQPYVSIDHSFGVKGVGTVALGILRNGGLKAYDKFKIVPSMKDTMVRSIQKHDQAFKDAIPGERVGLSLKDLKPEDVPRGHIISNVAKELKKVKILINKNEFYKEEIKKDDILYLSIGMQFFLVNVISNGKELEIESDKKFAYVTGMKIFVLDLNAKQRFVGTAKIIE